jgi:hypothetical protein
MLKIAHCEPLPANTFLIRVGPAGWEFGDPYEISLVLIDHGEGLCELRGLDKTLLPSHWRAVRQLLQTRGFIQAIFDRRKDGTIIYKSITDTPT